jgi:hypothetical protein
MLPARRSPTHRKRVGISGAGATRGGRDEARQKQMEYPMPTLSITPRMHFPASQSGHGSFAVDALIALALVLVVVFAMIALIALLGSADPSTAVAAAADGGMLILPP